MYQKPPFVCVHDEDLQYCNHMEECQLDADVMGSEEWMILHSH